MRRLLKKGTGGQGTIVLGCVTTPYLLAYRWSNDGFGVQMLVSPAAPSAVSVRGFSPDGEYVLGTHAATSPYLSVWPITHVGGFGTKVADPNTAVGATGAGARFSADGAHIVATQSTTPYIQAYEWSSGFGLKFAAPATAAGASGGASAFHPEGNAVAMSIGVSPFINAWQWSALGFGAKYTNPAAALFQPVQLRFSPTGGAIVGVWGSGGTPYIYAYPWTYASGFGAKKADPSTVPAGNSSALAFNTAGTVVAVGHVTAPLVSFYAWSDAGGFGAKFGDPGTAVGGTLVLDIKFLPGDKVVLLVINASPYIEAYEWDNTTGFGAKFDAPGTAPPGAVSTVDFYPA